MVMLRPAAWLLTGFVLVSPLTAQAGDASTALGEGQAAQQGRAGTQDVNDFVSGITDWAGRPAEACYEADEKEDRPDLASRPQS
ncbi:MAG: hypothetical protein CMM61_16925 [Rhodospirillaceae bacterium]|nr:hypothetical protein [Rhodospirillaceae bacterium]